MHTSTEDSSINDDKDDLDNDGNRLTHMNDLIEMFPASCCCVDWQTQHGRAVSLHIQHRQIGIATQVDCYQR
jgi:hypothetical protein